MMIEVMKLLIFAFIFLFVSQEARAQERREFYVGVRGLGMGGAQIATVNDETAMLVNPAGLGKLRNYFLTVADPEIHISGDTQAVIGSDIMAPLDPQETLNLLKKPTNHDRNLHSKVQAFPSLVFPNFGLGVFANYTTDASYDAANDELSYFYRSDLAMVLGFNFRFWDGRIKLGFNLRAMNRNEIQRTDIPGTSTNLSIKNLTTEGFGLASDVGLIMTMPWKLLPTLAFVYRDAGNTRYTFKEGLINGAEDAPMTTPATLDAAFAIFPILGKNNRFTFTGEIRDVLTLSEEDSFNRRMHLGLEFNIRDALFIRGGMNQNYWTAGVELAVANYQLQLATYGEDIGIGTAREDRRYVGKFAYRF